MRFTPRPRLTPLIVFAILLLPQGSPAQGTLDPDAIALRVIALVDSQYVFEDLRPVITAPIRTALAAGAYRAASSPDSLAAALTRDLRAATGDGHLYVERARSMDGEALDWDAWAEQERIEEQTTNFGFTEARVLDGNVGYLRIVGWMEPQRGYDAAASAMRFLERTDAILIDVRGNGGGYGGLAELIVSYFFEPPPTLLMTTYYSDASIQPSTLYSLPFVPGARRVGHPLFVLVDKETGSASEFFAYTLQAFGKAVVVGEPSHGAANRNSYYDLGWGLRLSVSTGAPVNAVTGTNWEGEGVQPDLAVPATEALHTAHAAALRALLVRTTDSAHRKRLEAALRVTNQGG